MNLPRAYFSLLAMGNAFVAIGGITNEGYTAEMETLDFINSDSWIRQNSNLCTARSSFVALNLPSTTTGSVAECAGDHDEERVSSTF